MTRKDFELIANVLKASSTSPMNRCVIKELAVSLNKRTGWLLAGLPAGRPPGRPAEKNHRELMKPL